MHIPDGYLSPSTCATLYAGAFAGWYAALKRLKRLLLSRVVPLISVFAAFAFVVMMFNLPLPGGTTGHAIGVTIAAIVLGPSGAILAISIALTIQALFFGDGGITTLGANCFNMAIVGSLVAYGSYRLIADGCEHRIQTKDRGCRGLRLPCRERRRLRCCDRVRNSAPPISRCGRDAAVRAVSIPSCFAGNDDRPSDLRGIGGGGNFRRAGRVLASR